MHFNLKNGLTTVAMLTTVIMGLGSGAAFADSADQQNDGSQMNHQEMNHEQMMNSDGEMQMQMQECSDNPDAQMNHQEMSSSEHQMSMQQCADNPDAEMNHEQMMNSDGEQMPMPDNSPTSNE